MKVSKLANKLYNTTKESKIEKIKRKLPDLNTSKVVEYLSDCEEDINVRFVLLNSVVRANIDIGYDILLALEDKER